MSIHPAVASRFHHLEGLTSFEAAFADPEQAARLGAFMFDPSWPQPPVVATRETVAPGPHGPVRVRVYEPSSTAMATARAWCGCTAERSRPATSRCPRPTGRRARSPRGPAPWSSASTTGSAVGGVTYPVPLDDVVSALRWVRRTASELGVDPERISIGGASAGGNLASGAALRAARRGRLDPGRACSPSTPLCTP